LEKNSFSLLETIFAITIISIIIGGFLKTSNFNHSSHINLQNIKNNLIQNNSDDIKKSSFGFEYVLNANLEITLLNIGTHTKLTYDKNNIFFEKYNLNHNSKSLNSKVYK